MLIRTTVFYIPNKEDKSWSCLFIILLISFPKRGLKGQTALTVSKLLAEFGSEGRSHLKAWALLSPGSSFPNYDFVPDTSWAIPIYYEKKSMN